MIFLSAGHNYKKPNPDPGAMATHNGITYKEADLTIELRDLIAMELDKLGAKYILDRDDESLADYLKRIKPGDASVLCELHFNSAAKLATGVETIVKTAPTVDEMKLAAELNQAIVIETGLFNRGVKTEAQSHRGRLAVLHTAAGISVLPEICFINNPMDIGKYQSAKKLIAWRFAAVLSKYDKLYV